MEENRRAETGTPRLKREPTFGTAGVDVLRAGMDLDEPLAAVATIRRPKRSSAYTSNP
jgi:hypothetical protein